MTNLSSSVPAQESIPPLAHDGYLPPFVGDARLLTGRAPYSASVGEFVSRFKFSKWRCEVLAGFLTLRRKFYFAGIRNGFMWVDGSFAANIKPEPGDLDVVTFYSHAKPDGLIDRLKNIGVDINAPGLVKTLYHCDSYMVNMSEYNPDTLIIASSYWYSLFSHTRDKQWKGLVQLRLLGSASEALNELRLQRSLLEGT